jgi:drug/metabolite transporter (DMT)-like permease
MNKLPTNNNVKAILFAILAAALYGISSPISKLLLQEVPPTLMAAFLYLGAGFGMLAVNFTGKIQHKKRDEAKITSKEMPYILGMVILDVAAPVLLMFGLSLTTAANAALLNNFEIVATSFIALLIFKESIGKRMWLAILLITTSSFILTVQDYTSFSFSMGSVFVLLACVCWGFENNCTRMLSMKDPRQIVVIKGLGSGTGSLLIALIGRQFSSNILYLALTLLLGFVAYGLSIYFYIIAQRDLGAARTSSYYATAPFIGVLISWLVLHERLSVNFIIALAVMLTGAYFAVTEMHKHLHVHEPLTHEHKHSHADSHHNHVHEDGFTGEHCHAHVHEAVVHNHVHTPDIHHSHMHQKDEP